MNKNLVLVESPSKAKTINKYLGKDFVVEATIGHIRNLPKTKLGVDVDKNFEPQFLNIRGKGDVIKKIKSLAQKSDKIYVATDPDREGEAIAQDIADVLGEKNSQKIFRVLFNEITKKAVQKAIDEPLKIDSDLVSSQRARRVMDRIIGYKISPHLWMAVIETAGGSSLSAGRVQSVALRLICEREEEIEKFIPTEYWSIWAEFKTASGDVFIAKLAEVDGKSIKIQPKPKMTDQDWQDFLSSNFAISNENDALNIVRKLKEKKEFIISDAQKKEMRRNPSPPFITSSLQSEASKKLRFRPKQTMGIAQSLYEGIELGTEGTVGLITYMRTDSTRLSPEIVTEAKDYIVKNFGDKYYPETPRVFNSKSTAKVQDAHEAIRPTSLKYTPQYVKSFLDPKQYKLYELIWQRFLASQMSSAVLETTSISISAGEFLFRASGSAIIFEGFLSAYEEQNEEAENTEENGSQKIPLGLKSGDILNLLGLDKNQHFTKPAPRFTESSLIKELESRGIGRPSTYAGIVGTIQERKYVNMEERKLVPTSLGKKVNKILVKNFPEVLNVNFTAKMEDELDQIANGENEYSKVLSDFYDPFSKALIDFENNIEKIHCDKCGHDMEIKIGRFGKYLACSNYPECTNIKSLREVQENQEPEYTGETCEKCGSRTIYRYGKFGKFIGCEKFPDCDFIKPVTLGITCPKCHKGEIVERKSKRGKVFYGCSSYPDCDFAAWHKPEIMKCPNNDSEYMERRYTAKKGEYLKCPVCAEEIKIESNNEESNNDD